MNVLWCIQVMFTVTLRLLYPLMWSGCCGHWCAEVTVFTGYWSHCVHCCAEVIVFTVVVKSLCSLVCWSHCVHWCVHLVLLIDVFQPCILVFTKMLRLCSLECSGQCLQVCSDHCVHWCVQVSVFMGVFRSLYSQVCSGHCVHWCVQVICSWVCSGHCVHWCASGATRSRVLNTMDGVTTSSSISVCRSWQRTTTAE